MESEGGYVHAGWSVGGREKDGITGRTESILAVVAKTDIVSFPPIALVFLKMKS